MKKTIIAILWLIFIAGCSSSGQPAKSSAVSWLRDLEAAKEMAKSQGKPILIDFYAEWCGWCKRMDEDVYANQDVGTVCGQFICVKIDADQNQQLTQEYKVQGLPSTVFLKADGTLIRTVAGYMPADQFIALIKQILEKI
ncbi:MAG: thioredoxin family protein [Candidatus Omnitrophica bacterium]|nr:thioredoxin family protein [Candidatus Omnitrophota bacterium]